MAPGGDLLHQTAGQRREIRHAEGFLGWKDVHAVVGHPPRLLGG